MSRAEALSHKRTLEVFSCGRALPGPIFFEVRKSRLFSSRTGISKVV